MTWMGENPYYLVASSFSDVRVIDLDERQWATKHDDVLCEALSQTLCEKVTGEPVLTVETLGESSARYSSRVFVIMRGDHRVTAYGFKIADHDGYHEWWWLPWRHEVVDRAGLDAAFEDYAASLDRGPSGIIPPA